jgi:epoxide hydrolase
VHGRPLPGRAAHPRHVHWLTGTAGSAPRIYAEEDRQQPPSGPTTIPPGLSVPLGLAQFPNAWPSDRALAERQGARIVSWNVCDRGGHYAARQAPGRSCVR